MEKQFEENQIQTKELIKKLGETHPPVVANINQWSSIVKKDKFPPLIIKPKQAGQDSEATKNAVIKKINPTDISAEVKRCKQAGNGSVVIECSDKESLQKMQTKALAELSDQYTVAIPKIICPKIIIVGVENKYVDDEADFVRRVKNQGSLQTLENVEIKFIKKFVPKGKTYHNVILELSPDAFQCLVKNKRVFFDWDSYAVYEYIGVLRCYKCWKYGHKAVNCQQNNIICPLCNQNHKSEECTSNVKECINCKFAHDVLKISGIDYRHSVFDKNCISYQRAQEKVKARTQYS